MNTTNNMWILGCKYGYFFRTPITSNFPVDFDGNSLIFWDSNPHRILVLGIKQILDQNLSQNDLLTGSKSMDLDSDLPEPPALLLLSQNARNEECKQKVSFVCYHGGHLCRYDMDL